MTLSVADYDRLEAEARRRLSNRAQGAFKPATFLAFNYPAQVEHDDELIRFVDTMHEYAARHYYQADFPLSEDEAELIRAIAEETAALTRDAWGRSIRPWIAPFAALPAFRALDAWARAVGKREITVMEIGPGSGFLGALLHKAGHRHISLDNAQPFYLWQNRLYSRLAGNGFVELAEAERIEFPAEARMAHLPWWRYVALHEQAAPQVDVVVCDHAIGEIANDALRYILNQSRRMLEGEGARIFMVGALGTKKFNTPIGIFRDFQAAGFDAVFKRLFYGFAPKGSVLAPLVMSPEEVASSKFLHRLRVKRRRDAQRASQPLLALDHAIPRYNPSGRPGTAQARDVIPLAAAEAPLDYGFLGAAGIPVPAANA